MRGTKARVDTHWKNPAATNGTLATRTNSITGEVANSAAANQRKILTRSNSVRLGTTGSSAISSTGLGLQRHASAHLLVGQNKSKTLTTKVFENKVQQVKSKTRTII